jgi:hypothetical protein
MGIQKVKIAECEVLQFECDDRNHDLNLSAHKAWFSCGTSADSLRLAHVSGWVERGGAWICPHCASRAAPSRKKIRGPDQGQHHGC